MLALVFVAAASTAPLDLHLICDGGGVQGGSATAQTYSYDSDGNSRSTTVTIPRSRSFDDQVRVDIAGDSGRIRIPQAMLPPIRGGKEGWFDLRKVEATDSDITAVATINVLNKVKLRLDRISGTISFTTLRGQFMGRCTAYDPATTQRAF
jgi:hypothetical protein